ncbi:MAG: hypothetical protein WD294_16205 [Phycisphaeraceae bacterium]
MVTMAAAVSFAQQDQRGPGDRGPRGGGQGFDPQQMQARMLNAMRERLGFEEDEWEAVQPKLQNVMTLRAEGATRGMGMMFRGPGARGPRDGEGRGPGARGPRDGEGRGPGARGPRDGEGRGPGARGPRDEEPSALQQSMRNLGETIADEDASEEKIAEALAEFREAKQKHDAELNEAQEELRGLLMPRQEAAFVMMGLLD